MPATHSPVLIIDDEINDRESLALLLAENGFNAVTASDGQEALERLEAGLRPCLSFWTCSCRYATKGMTALTSL